MIENTDVYVVATTDRRGAESFIRRHGGQIVSGGGDDWPIVFTNGGREHRVVPPCNLVWTESTATFAVQ